VSQTAASPAVTIATACLGALAFLIVGSWFVGIVIAVLVLIILHKKKKPAAQAESKDAPVVVELVARIN
jgi:cytosine/uracil/thiamine/allantoin permease